MTQSNNSPTVETGSDSDFVDFSATDTLSGILRDGAQQMLKAAIEREVSDFVNHRRDIVDENGDRFVVRNGSLPEREILTGVGPLTIKQPRVRDNRPVGERETFSSSIVPKYLRKTKSIEEMIPWLYLKGISTNDFPEALQSLFGADAKGLSASTVTRLKSVWEDEYTDWSKRSLAGKRYVYMWADGIHSNVRFNDNEGRTKDEKRQCLLVLMGATADGTKELIAVVDGYRESELSWKEILLDLQARGLTFAPELAIGDGALGFWKALKQVFPGTRMQRCTVHKTANVLNKMPKSVQPQSGKESVERNLAIAHKRIRRKSRRPVRKNVRCEVPGVGEMSRQRSRRVADVLRFPGRELVSHSHNESDRKHVCHHSPETSKDEGERQCQSERDDDLQAGSECVKGVEKTSRPSSSPRSSQGKQVHRRSQREPTQERRPQTRTHSNNSNRNRRLINFL